MKDSMQNKLENLILKYDELNKKLSAENITNDLNIFKKISKEHSDLSPIIETYTEYKKIIQNISEAKEMLSDPEMKEFAQEGMTMREQELVNAFNLLKDLIENFVQNKKNENISLTIALKTYFEDVQENELKKALKDIKNGNQADEVCKKLARNLTKKLLHHPTKSLNENKKNAQIIKEIYNLKD